MDVENEKKLNEIMIRLEELGTEQTKKTFLRHGAVEPLFGVKIGDLKKLVKFVKKNQDLALMLFDTGNSDAIYLAGLAINPKIMTKDQLQQWIKKASWHMVAETIVAGVAAESPFGWELAKEWITSDEELVASCGWSTATNYISVTEDENIHKQDIEELLRYVELHIHNQKNRVRYTMNNFVIGVGSFYKPLNEEAKKVAEKIGKVSVDVGKTACKVPLATDYIAKVEAKGYVGRKRKTCIC